MNRVRPDKAGIAAAVATLQAGEVIAYPTETVYGLGANPFSEATLDALFNVKEREPGKPVLLIVDTFLQIEDKVRHISKVAQRCMEQFWPGPLSLVLPAVPGLPRRLLDADGNLCVRCPDHPTARQICRAWGGAITSTSANLSGQPPARTADDAVLPGVALVMDAGTLDKLPPSTVYNPESGVVLREGPVTADMLNSL